MNKDERRTLKFQKAERLRNYRKLMCIKGIDMAILLNLDPTNYSKLENGYSIIKDETLELAREKFKKWRHKEAERVTAYLEHLYSIQ